MKDENEVTKVCSFTARERPMVQKVLKTTISISKQSGFGVAVENPCSKSGPTVGSFFHVYAEFVEGATLQSGLPLCLDGGMAEVYGDCDLL